MRDSCSRSTKATAFLAPWPTVKIKKILRGRFFGLLGFFLRSLGLVSGGRLGRLRAIGQRNERERRVIAFAEAHFQDPQVTAVALGKARAEVVEELGDDVA